MTTADEENEIENRLLVLLREFTFEPNNFKVRVEKAKLNSKIGNASFGLVTANDLFQLITTVKTSGFSVGNNFHNLIANLCKWNIFQNIGQITNVPVGYLINANVIKVYESLGILDNFLFETTFLIRKYSQATPAIIINKSEIESIGTSAVVRFGTPSNRTFFLLTNKHVVDPHENISVKRIEIGNQDITKTIGPWHLSGDEDLAAAEIDWPHDRPYFCITDFASHLTKVFSFGYPKIPFSDHNYIAIHSGEINSVIRTTAKELMYLISNPVSPGSSGGPVIDERGLLVALTAKSFQGKMEPESDFLISWNAAIPMLSVRSFLQKITGFNDWSEHAKELLGISPPPKEPSP